MKSVALLLLVVSFSTVSFAKTVLTCSPPDGSGLQEITITIEDGKVYRAELDFDGNYSDPVLVNAASWQKKDLHWSSEAAGRVHMKQVKEDGGLVWAYKSSLGADDICAE